MRKVTIVFGVVLLLLTACTGEKPLGSTTPSTKVSAAPTESYDDFGIGIPPPPNEKDLKAYIAELNKIDPDIVHGNEYTAVERGRNQCSTIKVHPDNEQYWISLAEQRFTSPQHPEGFGKVTASKILAVVRKYLCPSY